ncbi:Rho GTPase-activating protein 6 [Chionoecetes opilio]|uniref:Rho GTPase-activating protein 6 n=1 Tax=Chionoecetes opilio TaxID=41210 RepID=A0A8J4XV45_CHIOP|nr:Rho GTPase-activating protein 6 [Chionoecetes opilio]
MEGEDPQGRRGSAGGRKEGKTSRLKERWLLTRKTWRYMSDAGKKLFPEGVNPQRSEDLPRVAQHFQQVNSRQKEFILWPHPPDTPRAARRARQRQDTAASDTSDDFADSDHEGAAALGSAPRVPDRPVGTTGGVDVGVGVTADVGVPSIPGGHSCSGSPVTSPGGTWPPRERLVSLGELRMELPPELYQQLLRVAGSCTLQHVASRLQEEQLTEEDEEEEEDGEDDEPEDLLCMAMPGHRSVAVQTDPRLDMCVQTDEDAAAEDSVKVGAETHSVTEAAAAAAQAQERAQALSHTQGEPGPHAEAPAGPSQPPETPEVPPTAPPDSGSSTSILKKLWQRRESAASASVKAEEALKDTRREGGGPKGSQVAAKLAWAEKAAAAGPPPSPKPKDKPAEKSRLKNVFKLGLKCDVEGGGGGGKKAKDKDKEDKDRFKTVNYDKTLRNIKSRWVPSPEDEALLQQYRQHLGERDPRKIKRKSRGVQVGEPLPQFILAGIRINAPVEIVHQRRLVRRLRRRLSKADSSDLSSSECSVSVPPSLPTSPRYSVTVTDGDAARDLLLGEAELLRLAALGVLPLPVTHLKRPSSDASVDTSEFDAEGGGGAAGGAGLSLGYQRSLSALQASGHLAQLLAAIRSRAASPQVSGGHGGGGGSGGTPRGSLSLLQSLLPAVMQRSRAGGSGGGGGSGHGSRLVAKKMWRARSKSQSRASPANTCVWTPVGCHGQGNPDVTVNQGCHGQGNPDVTVNQGCHGQGNPDVTVNQGCHCQGNPDVTVNQGCHGQGSPDVTVNQGCHGQGNPDVTVNQGCHGQGNPDVTRTQVPTGQGNPDVTMNQGCHGQGNPDVTVNQGCHGQGKPDVTVNQGCHGQGNPDVTMNQGCHGQGNPDITVNQGCHGQGNPDVTVNQGCHGQGNGNNTWSSVTGRLVGVERACLLHLTDLERLTLRQVATAKLQALSLGCTIRVPSEQPGSSGRKKRRPYLLKRKALTTGIFDNKKDEVRDGMEGGQVFGLALSKCLENERTRNREAAEKAALAMAAAATTTQGGDGETRPLSRKSSQGGSHASFSSLNEATKQLREEFDKGREVWLSEDQCPHDVATLLKEFFRDLPEPLLTRELYEAFIKTQSEYVPAELMDETYQHLMDTHPEALDILLRRRCVGGDE